MRGPEFRSHTPNKKLTVGVHAYSLRTGETETGSSLELTSLVELARSRFSERPVSKYKAEGASKMTQGGPCSVLEVLLWELFSGIHMHALALESPPPCHTPTQERKNNQVARDR